MNWQFRKLHFGSSKECGNPISTECGMDILIEPRNKPVDFLYFSKAKIAAVAAITTNYEIVRYLKNIQARDSFFCTDPCFQK